MQQASVDIEVYESIEEMKLQSDQQQLSLEESFLKVLDILDMFAAVATPSSDIASEIEWIDLTIE